MRAGHGCRGSCGGGKGVVLAPRVCRLSKVVNGRHRRPSPLRRTGIFEVIVGPSSSDTDARPGHSRDVRRRLERPLRLIRLRRRAREVLRRPTGERLADARMIRSRGSRHIRSDTARPTRATGCGRPLLDLEPRDVLLQVGEAWQFDAPRCLYIFGGLDVGHLGASFERVDAVAMSLRAVRGGGGVGVGLGLHRIPVSTHSYRTA